VNLPQKDIVAKLRSWVDEFVAELAQENPDSGIEMEAADVVADFLIHIEDKFDLLREEHEKK
jgi:hypothetical protein